MRYTKYTNFQHQQKPKNKKRLNNGAPEYFNMVRRNENIWICQLTRDASCSYYQLQKRSLQNVYIYLVNELLAYKENVNIMIAVQDFIKNTKRLR